MSSHPPVPIASASGTVRSVSAAQPGAADLIRSIGLLADGPVRWGSPVPARKAGLYVVELGAPAADRAARDDPRRQVARAPARDCASTASTRPRRRSPARLASFWWPDATVLYAGATDRSIGGRVAALARPRAGRSPAACRRPVAAPAPRPRPPRARIWWAETDAPEEYLDAFFDAFGAGASRRRAARRARSRCPGRTLRRPDRRAPGPRDHRRRSSRRRRARPSRRGASSTWRPATPTARAARSAARARPGARRQPAASAAGARGAGDRAHRHRAPRARPASGPRGAAARPSRSSSRRARSTG